MKLTPNHTPNLRRKRGQRLPADPHYAGCQLDRIVICLVNYCLLNDDTLRFYGVTFNFLIVLGWLALFILFELIVSRRIAHPISSRQGISTRFKIIHSLAEVSLPGGLIFYMVGIKHMPIFLDAPP